MDIRKNIYYWKSDRPHSSANVQVNNTDHVAKVILEQQLRQYLSTYLEHEDFSIEPAGGQGNHITYLLMVGNEKYFIRVENGPEMDDYMDVESMLLSEIIKLGVPCPKVFKSDSSRTLVPFAIQIMEYMKEADLNQLKKKGTLDLQKIAFEIGKNIAAWQKITPEKFGLFNPSLVRSENQLCGYHDNYANYFFLNWDVHLDYLLEQQFLSEQKVAEIRHLVSLHRDLLDLKSGCLVHKDLALWNILGDEREIKAFIDWDDAISGDPVDDLSLLGCFHSGDHLLTAIAGYQSIKSLPENFLNRFWMHLLRNMIFKSVIRVRGNYFSIRGDFFMMGKEEDPNDFRVFTLARIDSACKGLKGEMQISELS